MLEEDGQEASAGKMRSGFPALKASFQKDRAILKKVQPLSSSMK
jgi:hypothetical protein